MEVLLIAISTIMMITALCLYLIAARITKRTKEIAQEVIAMTETERKMRFECQTRLGQANSTIKRLKAKLNANSKND